MMDDVTDSQLKYGSSWRCTIPPMSNHSAQQVLHDVFGYSTFRGEQKTIVEHVTSGGDALVLMPTGGGKSLCYQLPALLREGVGIRVSLPLRRVASASKAAADGNSTLMYMT